jgi:ABC-2 type transport system ATP-binding protein
MNAYVLGLPGDRLCIFSSYFLFHGDMRVTLTIKNLSKQYRNGVQALDDVSLTIPTGMFGLLGPNGAGKSTLMRTLATLQEADSGSAELDGLDVLREKNAVRRILGYLPQEFGLYPKVSASRMLNHFAALKGIGPASRRKEVVEQLLQKTNLYAVRRRNLGGFSGGMKQRFGIALALLGDPKLIIVDEPTAGLDPEERVRFLNLLSEIGEHVIVILSTHIVGDVSDLCSRMAIIYRGKVIRAGQPAEFSDELQGHVFRKLVDKEELPQLREQHEIISTRLAAGKSLVHVYSDEALGGSFEAIEPDLQDVYFRAVQQQQAAAQVA